MLGDKIHEATVIDDLHAFEDAVGDAARLQIGQQGVDGVGSRHLAQLRRGGVALHGRIDGVLDQ